MDTKVEPIMVEGAPWILILGPKGAGKSRLAGTMPGAFCLDTEPPGAASAFPKDMRQPFKSDERMYEEVARWVKEFCHDSKKDGKFVVWSGKRISALVIDTFDSLQKFLISRYLSQKKKPTWIKQGEIWAAKMEMQDWGTILNYQSPLVTDLKTLPIPVIWTCHTKVSDPLYEGRGDSYHCRKIGSRTPDVSGSIEGWIVNLCDYILNINVGEDMLRTVYTQPTIVDDYSIMAADRHRLFGKLASFPMAVDENGFPARKVMQFICEHHEY